MLSDAQLACVAVAAGPVVVGLMFALGNMVPVGLSPAPSPARVARLCVGLPAFAAIWIIGFALDAVAVVLDHVLDRAERSVLRLRDWMDV